MKPTYSNAYFANSNAQLAKMCEEWAKEFAVGSWKRQFLIAIAERLKETKTPE